MKKQTIKLNISNAVQETYPDSFNGVFLIDVDNVIKEHNFIFEECSIFLCTQGDGIVRINEKEYVLSPDSILFLPPNYLIRRVEGSNNFQARILFFSVDMITDLVKKSNYNLSESINNRSCLKISHDRMLGLLEFYSFLKKEYDKPDYSLKKDMIQVLLLAFLIKIAEIYSCLGEDKSALEISRSADLTKQFFRLLRLHYREERSLLFYANKMFLSRKYLSTTIKKTTGRPALTWINEHVIFKAKVLIKTTNLTAAEISDTLNFPNPSFFGRLFKKYTGMTPNEYRRN